MSEESCWKGKMEEFWLDWCIWGDCEQDPIPANHRWAFNIWFEAFAKTSSWRWSVLVSHNRSLARLFQFWFILFQYWFSTKSVLSQAGPHTRPHQKFCYLLVPKCRPVFNVLSWHFPPSNRIFVIAFRQWVVALILMLSYGGSIFGLSLLHSCWAAAAVPLAWVELFTCTDISGWMPEEGILVVKSNQNFVPFLTSNPYHQDFITGVFGQVCCNKSTILQARHMQGCSRHLVLSKTEKGWFCTFDDQGTQDLDLIDICCSHRHSCFHRHMLFS